MISYGMSIIGTAHEKNGTICQDAHKIVSLDNGWVIAAVADGVGSCKYSDVSSAIAVDVATDYCAKSINCDLSQEEIMELIENSFTEAEIAIEKKSVEDCNLITEYDTTLSLVIYDGKHATYGHCGDGGVIGLTTKGDYLKITTPQKKEGVYVIPLRAGKDTWVFGSIEEELASILLSTDGVYDMFFPYLLKGQPVEIYVPLIRYFMDNNGLNVTSESIEKLKDERENFLRSNSCASITDDKTIIAIINENSYPEKKNDDFYTEPNWENLQLEWNKKVYPHLYNLEG